MIGPLICAVAFLLLCSSAKADTFTLTAGSANTGFAQFSLFASGPNISIGGGAGLCTVPGCDAVFVPDSFAFATCSPSPCAPGSTLNVGGVFVASNLNIGNNFGGAATINGVDFFGLNFGGELNFTGSIVLPNDYVNGQPVTVPFSMQGQLTGFVRCPGSMVQCSQQVFDISLNGSGIATATLPAAGNGLVIYTFGPAAESVPEPATLGLLGVGLFALKRFYRSRKINRF
jgi:hypothetical protein